jgi:manganese efflux pump family protein
MDWAALITWVLTAGGGLVLLTVWVRNGGMAQSDRGHIRPAVILTHFALAATGLVLWIVYVASDSSALAWIAFALLLVVALIGFTMFGIWAAQRRTGALPAQARGERSAEQHFPTPIVGLHGLLAATTLVLVFLAAAGVGS